MVPENDIPTTINKHKSVHRRFGYGSKPQFRLPQGLLCLFALRNVFARGNDADRLIVGSHDNVGHQLNRERGSVLSDVDAFSAPVVHVLDLLHRCRFPTLRRSKNSHVFADQIINGSSVHLRFRRIHISDLAGWIGYGNTDLSCGY